MNKKPEGRKSGVGGIVSLPILAVVLVAGRFLWKKIFGKKGKK